jgi:hypothetical protein
LKQVVVHLDEPAWEPWLDDLEILVPPPAVADRTPGRLLWQRKAIADAMNYFLKQDRARAESIASQIEEYRSQLRAVGLRIDSPIMRMNGLQALARMTWNLFLLILLLVPAMLGTLYHILPFVLVRQIASRMDQPGRLTISTHRLLVGVPVYLIWYAAITTGLTFYDPRIAWLSLIAAPFAGLVAVYYWRRARQTIVLMYQESRLLLSKTELKGLWQLQRTLSERLAELATEFAGTTSDLPDSFSE